MRMILSSCQRLKDVGVCSEWNKCSKLEAYLIVTCRVGVLAFDGGINRGDGESGV